MNARKKKDIKLESLKLTSLASSLISLNLTQIAIFSFKGASNVNMYNGNRIRRYSNVYWNLYDILYKEKHENKL